MQNLQQSLKFRKFTKKTKMDINKQVCAKIQQVREDKKIKISAVASAVNLSPSA